MPNKPKLIVANWKMNLGHEFSSFLANDIANGLRGCSLDNLKIVICPSFISLKDVNEIFKKSGLNIKVGAQNMFWETAGAYTGEIAPIFLKELDCHYAIIGHSERRLYLHETNKMINQKIKTALTEEITPILCVGETQEERKDGAADYVIMGQLKNALEGIIFKADQKIIVAYEPTWVIGTGQVLSPEEVSRIVQLIKKYFVDHYSPEFAEDNLMVIYGGSINSRNIKSFAQQDIIDGFGVGGASLNADEFIRLIKSIL